MTLTPSGDQEQLLREHQLIFDRAQIGIVVMRDRVIQRCNRRFEQIMGFDPGELVGKSTRIFYFSEAQWLDVGRRAYSAVEASGSYTEEDIYRRRDGDPVCIHVTGSLINPDRPEDGYVWLYEDITEKRRSEDAMKAVLREQTMIFERAQIGIGVLQNRVIQRCNRRLEEIFGYAPGELLGKSTLILFPSDEAWEALGRRGYSAMAEAGEFRAEQEYRRKDGQVVWCQFDIRPINPDNPQEGHLVLFDDVTEQRQAEAALTALLNEQTMIFERAHTGIMFLRNRVIQRCNPRFEQIFGHPPGFLVGQSTRVLFADEQTWTDAGVWIYAQLAESRVFESDINYVRGDGTPICCHVVGSLLDEQNPETGSVWLYEDITTRRATEEALQQSLREQQLMFDNAMIGIAYSRHRVIVRCNPRFEELLGYGPGELVGKSTRIYYASDEAWNAMGPRIAKADAERQTFEDEVSFCRRDGTPIWVHVIGRTVDTAEGRTWIWAYEDITARRAAEMALARNAREYSLIFDNAMIGISYQRNRVFVRCNRRLEEMFRHPPGSLAGQSTRVLFPTEAEWRETGQRVYEVAADRQTFDGEMRYCRKDGTVIWCHIVGRLTDSDADGQNWIWTYDDITARRAAETALARNAREYSLIFDNAMIGIAYVRDRVLLRCNRRFEEIYGFQPGAATGKTTRSMFASDEEYVAFGRRARTASEEGRAVSEELLYRRQDGAPIWVRVNGQSIREGGEQIWVWTCQEVTRRRVAEDALRKSYGEMEQRVTERTAELSRQLNFMEQLIEAIPGPVFYKDREGRHLGCNQRFMDFLGKSRSELIGATVRDIAPDDLAGRASVIDEELFANPGSRVYEAQVQSAGGERLDVLVQKATFANPDGSVGGLIGVMFDITERKRMEERMQQAATVFDSSEEGIIIGAPDTSFIAVNRAFSEITGYAEQEVLGRQASILRSARDERALYHDMWGAIGTSGRWRGDVWFKRKDNSEFPASLTLSAIKSSDGSVNHYVGVFSDITEIKRATALLDHQAHHDHLTGLPNRLLLEDRLHGAVLRAQREQTQVAVLFIDLDRFKNINDSLGHHVGDSVLRDVAQRFCALTRESDTVARLGGDEFLIVMEGIHDAGMASRIADKILDDLRVNPVTLEQEFFVGASIGISLFPQDGADAEQLIKNADAAMYRAKERGRNACEFFSNELTQFSLDRFQMETDLRRAIERGELIVYLQPQFSLRTGALLGAEALVRWQHPQQGLVSPAKFIPLAEESGLIVALGEWVQHAACSCWAGWVIEGFRPGVLSINVSGVEFRRGQIQDTVRRVLDATGLAPALLELEITEGAIMSQAENSIQVLHDLRAMGISLAIDDFGTGYSSLAYLKRLPLNKLKVDQSFVRGLPDDAEDGAIARAVIALGHSLQLKVIAEGVETEAQRDFLIKADCDEMQGYLRGRPMLVDEFKREFLGA